MSTYHKNEVEYNDTMSYADNIGSLYYGDSATFSGTSDGEKDNDYFKFYAGASGTAGFAVSGVGDYDLWLYDASGTLLESDVSSDNSASFAYYLYSGNTYYLRVRNYSSSSSGHSWSGALTMPGYSSSTIYRPDLSVSNFSLNKTSMTTNESVTLTFDIDNYGNGSASSSRAYIYVDGSYWGSAYTDSLSAHSSSGWYDRVNYTLSGLSAGTHTIQVKADGGNSITESDESDNWSVTRSITVTNPARPNLNVDEYNVSSNNIGPNQSVTLTFDVNNYGNGNAGASYAYIYDGDTYLGSVYVGSLSGSASGTWYRTCTYTIAAGRLSAGTHRIYVKADGGNAISESNESDNSSYRTITVSNPTRDLKITDMAVSSNNITTAQSTVFTFRVVNNGNSTASANSIVLHDANGNILREVSLGSIAGGSSRSCQVTLTSGKLYPGVQRVYAKVDAYNQIGETNETNNTAYRTITVSQATRNLKITDMQVSDNRISTAQSTVFTFRVTNTGNTAVGATTLYLHDGYNVLREVSVGSIGAGGSRNCSVTLTSGKLSVGTHKVYAKVDAYDQVAENNETDNTSYRTIFVERPTRDLKITNMNISNGNTQYTNGQFKFNFQVTNLGNTSVGATKLYVYDDGNFLREVTLAGLNAGQTRNCTLTINASTLGVGTLQKKIKADGAGQISESYESNNSAYRTVFVNSLWRSADIDADDAKLTRSSDVELWKDDVDGNSLNLLADGNSGDLLSWDAANGISSQLLGAVDDTLSSLTSDEESRNRLAGSLLA